MGAIEKGCIKILNSTSDNTASTNGFDVPAHSSHNHLSLGLGVMALEAPFTTQNFLVSMIEVGIEMAPYADHKDCLPGLS